MTKTKKDKAKEKVKDEPSGGGSSKWSEADDAVLVETLTLQKAGSGWGDNNPKLVAWIACQTALVGSKIESGGAPKIGNVLKSRWQKVCPIYVHICAY